MSIIKKAKTAVGLLAAVPLSVVEPASLAHADPVQVEYAVLGSGAATINYEDGDGNDQVENDATLPWHKTVAFAKSGHISVMVTAWGVTDPLSCMIYVDGTAVAAVTQRQPLMCETDIQAS